MDNIFKEIGNLVSESYEMNDETLAEKCKVIFDKIPANLLVHSHALQKIIAKRVNTYCMINKIDIDQYDGPLSFRIFKIQK